MNNKGILVVVSGFSGSGKGTIMKRLMSKHGEDYALSVSATTRAPRPGEIHGVDYFYVSTNEFERMIEQGELIEYAKYVNNYYGTPKAYVEEQLNAGRSVILEIEMQGARKIKEQFPDTILMFVSAPTADEIKNRLIGRNTETEEVICARMHRAYEESLDVEDYDYLVINDELESSVACVHRLIQNERMNDTAENEACRLSANIEFIKNMREELLCFSKGV